MATTALKSLKGRRIRITRLDSCGAPVVGACSYVAVDGFFNVQWGVTVKAGEEYEQENAWGDLDVNEKDPDVGKWGNVQIGINVLDPDLLDILGGDSITPVVDATPDTIGWTWGPTANEAGFAIEVWTKAHGQACDAGTPVWGYFVAPWVKNGTITGNFTIEKGPLTMSLAGQAFGATSDWGTGPHGDNPFVAAAGFPVGEFFGAVTTDVQPPTVTTACGAVS